MLRRKGEERGCKDLPKERDMLLDAYRTKEGNNIETHLITKDDGSQIIEERHLLLGDEKIYKDMCRDVFINNILGAFLSVLCVAILVIVIVAVCKLFIIRF